MAYHMKLVLIAFDWAQIYHIYSSNKYKCSFEAFDLLRYHVIWDW